MYSPENKKAIITLIMTGIAFSPNSEPYGLTYKNGLLSDGWQWAYSIPKDVHPAYDDSGKYYTINQNGSV